MKDSILTSLTIALMLLTISGTANATLITIGTADYDVDNDGTNDILGLNLIWDDDNNGNSVVWLDYTNYDNWADQMSWAQRLNGAGALTYEIDPGYKIAFSTNSWRLPMTVDGVFINGYDGTTTGGYNITNSEMGHLYYTELGNLGAFDTNGDPQDGYGLKETGDFINLIESYWYWSSTEHADYMFTTAWAFRMNYGGQYSKFNKSNNAYGIAVWDGQVTEVAPIPEPATVVLFAVGILGFAGVTRRKQGQHQIDSIWEGKDSQGPCRFCGEGSPMRLSPRFSSSK